MRRAVVLAAVSALALTGVGLADPAWSQNRNAARATADARPRVDVAAGAVERPARAILFADQAPEGGVLVLPLGSAEDLATRGAMLSESERAAVTRALDRAGFRYGVRDSQTLRGLSDHDQIMVVGLPADASPLDHHMLGVRVGRALSGRAGGVTVAAHGMDAASAAEIGAGLGIGGYTFDRYKSSRASDDDGDGETGAPGAAVLVGSEGGAVFASRGQALIDAMTLARDLSNEPANVIYPETFVARASAAFQGLPGVEITVLDEAEMARLGMGALLSVGQGSTRPPRLMAVRYRGAGSADQPIVLAGKGITFDSGGISIKGSAGMGNMKMDMSGAANVVGTALALARQGAPVHVVAVAALAENMPDGSATRPGDVVRAMNGRTIEIISTDAEGRMVLADAVAWAEANLNPAAIVDIATLTGAVGGALGSDYAGLFSRHDALAAQLEAASEASGEGLWRLPLHPGYGRLTSSPVADIQNSGSGGPGAGTGAHFIGTFVSRDMPWAHLDIANMAYSGASDVKPAGSAGFGVRLLERFVQDYQPVPRGRGDGGH